jgi:hypothetical protein
MLVKFSFSEIYFKLENICLYYIPEILDLNLSPPYVAI